MKRPILWTTIFMICGIYMRLGISKVICLVSFLFLLFFMFRFVINKKKPAYLLLLFFVPLGFFSAGVHWQAEQSLLTKTVTGEGVILEEGETTSGNQKLTLRCSLEKQEKPCKVYAVWIGEERFQEGERVAFSGEIVPFSKQSYPGGYDEQLYLLTKGYEYKLYPEKIKVTGQDTSLSVRLARARAGVQMVLDRILPAEESGLMQAVLTGDKEKIPEESYTLYSKAGVVHVLCISGVKTLKLDIPLVPKTRINWAFVLLHIAIIYILKLCLDEEIIPRCRFPCSRGYLTKCINWQKKQ